MGSLRQAQWCMWCATRMTARAALGKSSEALAVIDVVAGRFHELRQGDQHHRLAPGAVAHIATGERVSLANPGTEPAVMMIVASPPEFVARLAKWPAA